MNRIPTEFRSNRHLITARPAPSSNRLADTGRPIPNESEAGGDGTRDFDQSQGEPMGGLAAFQAFGIATAIVLGSAGLGAWGIAKLMGVNDVSGPVSSSTLCSTYI